MRLSRDQALALIRDLEHPIMGSAPDEHLAEDHGVSVGAVRLERRRLRQAVLTTEVLGLAQTLGRLTGSQEPPEAVIVQCLTRAVRSVTEALRARGVTISDRCHSVGTDRGMRQVERTEKRSTGTSGIGIRGGGYREVPIGAVAVAHRGMPAAAEKREGLGEARG